ncbi:hypothetical protein GCM10010472_22950 [Pseudonocardia halophobica]|uniref:Integral membrane protein n=1 Tax=Pseudonocardia halophobica TaxID=29401 RepID=A0A9W6KYA1_9PSEU|nr:hypothetical protein [Pseudonocardia halophobica]GLL09528.1 hypothetical protein GCM10017577_06680 [Pseudonocardia halophobica]
MRADEDTSPSRPEPRARRLPRRRSDRVADLAAWTVCVAVLVVLGAAVVIGLRVHDGLSERVTAEARDRTRITAVLAEDVPVLPEGGGRIPADVRWTGPDGVERVGRVEVHGPKQAGDPVAAWVTTDGRVVRAPLTTTEAFFVTFATAGTVLLVGEFVVAALGHLAFLGVGRLHAAEWEREWAEVEPRWRSTR